MALTGGKPSVEEWMLARLAAFRKLVPDLAAPNSDQVRLPLLSLLLLYVINVVRFMPHFD